MGEKRLLASLLILFAPSFGGAYETDQFNNRLQVIKDSAPVMNKKVTLAIAETITNLHGPRDEMAVVNGIYYKIGGKHWVDKLERFAMESSQVERLNSSDNDSIYYGHPIWTTRVAFFFGIDETVRISGVLVGTDKFGHFLSQGRKFYKRWLKVGDESKAAEQSAFTERAIFGQMSTGSYSNADLVANYEGYLFYRSLFEGDVITNKPAILTWIDGRWIMQRPFDWSDHVNDYWDEALNVNHYDKLLYPRMRTRLLTLCDDYQSYPELFTIHNEELLKDRYHHLQLRDTSELRLSNLCINHQQDTDTTTHIAPDPQ